MRRNPNFILREVAGENILVPLTGDLELNGILSLNGFGCEIYKRIDETPSLDALVAALCELYDAPREVIAADVAEFIEKLKAEKLIIE